MTVFHVSQVADDELTEMFHEVSEESQCEWPDDDPFSHPPIDGLLPFEEVLSLQA